MKSYFLEGVSSYGHAEETLGRILPGQMHPWLLRDSAGDVVAYIDLVEVNNSELKFPAVTADISGRHFNLDTEVITILKLLQESVGGEITNDQ
ncbi:MULTISPECIES: hypothetical protein [Methylomonas]|uniref:Uncharacterized protein n=2 Tax=Methylomonas TaxID=416 RepID=A0A126T7A5_9GAMM|nr:MULTISPECIES: hypothetical protein [Methylomonas]AMK77910.1 hypothetical protein JT25_015735 [Methylomonas denitrificans]OAI08859.1 hypothetical protein A1342_09605 [Methylomonas methanica]TCV85442.1 hypothetical protein EDE11_1051 [Methylomonas methanica]